MALAPRISTLLSGVLAMPIFQPGARLHEGETLDKLAFAIRSMLGQNNQAPLPAVHSALQLTDLLYESAADGLVALAGGGQANATPIATSYATFGTVATAGDSGLLPAAVAGLAVCIFNAGAQSMNVFPAAGDAIGAGAANAAYAVAAGKSAQFFATAPGRWRVLLSA